MNEKREQQVQAVLRVGESIMKRAGKVAESLSKPGMRVTRTGVLRLALYSGLEKLEAECKKR